MEMAKGIDFVYKQREGIHYTEVGLQRLINEHKANLLIETPQAEDKPQPQAEDKPQPQNLVLEGFIVQLWVNPNIVPVRLPDGRIVRVRVHSIRDRIHEKFSNGTPLKVKPSPNASDSHWLVHHE